VLEYFRAHFQAVYKRAMRDDTSGRVLYAHFTAVVDVQQTHAIIADVSDSIFRNTLSSAGMGCVLCASGRAGTDVRAGRRCEKRGFEAWRGVVGSVCGCLFATMSGNARCVCFFLLTPNAHVCMYVSIYSQCNALTCLIANWPDPEHDAAYGPYLALKTATRAMAVLIAMLCSVPVAG
jgi:hypothetical protein